MKFWFKKLARRMVPFTSAMMLLFFSLMDCAFYKPMEAYAAATESLESSGFFSLIADALYSLGVSFADRALPIGSALNIIADLGKRRDEVLAKYPDMDSFDALIDDQLLGFKKKYTFGGAGRSFEVTGKDVAVASDFVAAAEAGETVTEVPSAFTNIFRAWALSDLNISAPDGSAPVSNITLSAEQRFDSYYGRLTRLNIVGSASYCYPTGVMWGARTDSGNYVYLWGSPGSKFMLHSSSGTESVIATLPLEANSNGYSHVLTPSLPVASIKNLPMYDANVGYRLSSYPVKVSAAGATIDIDYLGKDIAWSGEKDLDTTLANQKAATSKDDYVSKVITANPPIVTPTESESSGTGEGGGATLSGVLEWLSRINDSVIALPKQIGSAISTGWTDITDAVNAQGESIGKQLTELGDLVSTIPSSLAGIKDSVAAIPKEITAGLKEFFTLDENRLKNSFDNLLAELKARNTALQQIVDIFSQFDYDFSETPPIFYMQTPEPLKFALKSDRFVVMDLTPWAEQFFWVRTIIAGLTWVAFGKWLIEEFDIRFQVD